MYVLKQSNLIEGAIILRLGTETPNLLVFFTHVLQVEVRINGGMARANIHPAKTYEQRKFSRAHSYYQCLPTYLR